jgi:peptide/nickel transport system permease protein
MTSFYPEVGDAGRRNVRERGTESWLRRIWGATRPRTRLEYLGWMILGALLIAIVVLPAVIHLDPYRVDVSDQLRPPSAAHPFGTDNLGRDYLARVLYGGRVSILIALVVVALAGAFGMLVGAVAGYVGGVADEALMRVADVFLAFPSIMLALVVAGALGPSITNSAVAIAVAWWPAYARIIRGQVIAVRDLDYVTASRTIGTGPVRLLFRSILPNAAGVLKLILLLDLGYAILAAATLSYFGLGVQAPEPEWGVLIRAASEISGGWWMIVLPGVAIILFASAINFAGGVFTRAPRDRRP